jgi:hypothetical protein
MYKLALILCLLSACQHTTKDQNLADRFEKTYTVERNDSFERYIEHLGQLNIHDTTFDVFNRCVTRTYLPAHLRLC